jgi:membrane protein DedA with SNARE-associated domain
VVTDIGIPVPFVLDTILILTAYKAFITPDPVWTPVIVIVLALFVGRQVGSGILYMISRYLGGAFIRWLKCHVPSAGNRMDGLTRRLSHWATLTIVTGRLTPGLLQVTSVAAGTMRIHYGYFTLGVALASLVYDGILVLLGFIAAHSPRATDINFTIWLLISMVIIVCILWPIIFVAANRKEKKLADPAVCGSEYRKPGYK